MTAPAGEVRRVADRVLSRIVGGKYPAGLRLPAELDLATEFGCGRSTVREALRYLAGLGVVRSRRGSGALVLDFRREGTPALLPQYLLTGRFDRPPMTIARELLSVRSLLAREAVRLAARYADAESLDEPRRILAASPALAHDPVAHAWNELELFRALVFASGIWPAAWLANAFWGPMRELYGLFAPSIGQVAPDYQPQMTTLLELCARRDEAAADRHLSVWLARVDARLLDELPQVLGPGVTTDPPPSHQRERTPPLASTRETPELQLPSKPREVSE
jgi:DNA-binding FadR family transcriptional regulator